MRNQKSVRETPAWDLYESGTHVNLMDDRLDPNEYSVEDAKKIIEMALMCTQSPAMSDIVALLSEKSLYEMAPVRSTFHEDAEIHSS
uniref:Cysteine-rich receptor-like protein kinase 2 n=1 Tax=Tanacetum cinerariifolium TaxID=118510 RepID=A0A6L2N8B6_TANCI|nr:cysteine-rich receptor-like protein kinase 2 [Tanacetum cinerariifolium]